MAEHVKLIEVPQPIRDLEDFNKKVNKIVYNNLTYTFLGVTTLRHRDRTQYVVQMRSYIGPGTRSEYDSQSLGDVEWRDTLEI